MQRASDLKVSLSFWVGLGVRVGRMLRLDWNRPFLRTCQLGKGGGRHLQLWRFHYRSALMIWNIPKENDDDDHANYRSANSGASKPHWSPDWPQGQARTFVPRGIQQNALGNTRRQSGRGGLHGVQSREILPLFLQGSPIDGTVLLVQHIYC